MCMFPPSLRDIQWKIKEKLQNAVLFYLSPCAIDRWSTHLKIYTANVQVTIYIPAKFQRDSTKNDREIWGRRWLERRKIKSKKEKTLQQQEGLPTMSVDLKKTLQQQEGLPAMSVDLNNRNTVLQTWGVKKVCLKVSFHCCYNPWFSKQKRSTEGCSKFKSPETRQVQERLVSTLEHMQVPKWDRTRCPEE